MIENTTIFHPLRGTVLIMAPCSIKLTMHDELNMTLLGFTTDPEFTTWMLVPMMAFALSVARGQFATEVITLAKRVCSPQ